MFQLQSAESSQDVVVLRFLRQAQKVLKYLDFNKGENGNKTSKNIQDATQVSPSVIKTLERKGLIEKKSFSVKDLATNLNIDHHSNLNFEQKNA